MRNRLPASRVFSGPSLRWAALVAMGTCLSVGAASAQDQSVVEKLAKDSAVRLALDAARQLEPATLDEQAEITEVPAPPFKESARAALMKRKFEEVGLKDVRIDKAGNVVGVRPGLSARPNVVIAAHLDTVFPEGTDVRVQREGTVLRAPGIGDDGRGLTMLLAIARALDKGGVDTPGTITFVADVGEEGLGDLRGMKQLFGDTLKGQVDRFVSIDGTGYDVTHIAVGSFRYRVTFKGPGGHSYGAFGLVNPIHALGRALGRIADIQVPSEPKVTFNAGRIGGGTSINSIPYEAWFEMDMRSPDAAALRAVDAKFHEAVDAAVADENARWGKGTVTVTKDLVGERPAGRTPESSAIVQVASAVNRVLGLPLSLDDGSTDSNLPISLGIPAITVGGGGRGSGAHSLIEAFDGTDSWKGTQRAILLLVALAR